MSKAVSKRALRELAQSAESHFCDCSDHEPGECDLLLISPKDIFDLLEAAS